MTLSELKSKCYSMPRHSPPVKLYIFGREDDADNWILENFMGVREPNGGYELVAVIQSDMIMKYCFKEEWCDAEVQQFYAVAPDTLVVVAERSGEG